MFLDFPRVEELSTLARLQDCDRPCGFRLPARKRIREIRRAGGDRLSSLAMLRATPVVLELLSRLASTAFQILHV